MENNRYNNTKIYKMYDLIYGNFYIGSSTNILSKRLAKHKQDSKIFQDRTVYKIFNEIGWENVKIVLIEEHYLENKEQQLREEDRVLQMFLDDEKCLNSLRPLVPLDEQLRRKKERYYEDHEKKLNRMKVYRKEHIEKLKLQVKEHYQEHKQEALDYQEKYRNENRQKMRDRDNEKYICGCGTTNSHGHKSRHEKTKKHIAWLKDQQQTAETI